jgi:hypothetical protein
MRLVRCSRLQLCRALFPGFLVVHGRFVLSEEEMGAVRFWVCPGTVYTLEMKPSEIGFIE